MRHGEHLEQYFLERDIVSNMAKHLGHFMCFGLVVLACE